MEDLAELICADLLGCRRPETIIVAINLKWDHLKTIIIIIRFDNFLILKITMGDPEWDCNHAWSRIHHGHHDLEILMVIKINLKSLMVSWSILNSYWSWPWSSWSWRPEEGGSSSWLHCLVWPFSTLITKLIMMKKCPVFFKGDDKIFDDDVRYDVEDC